MKANLMLSSARGSFFVMSTTDASMLASFLSAISLSNLEIESLSTSKA
jgi:hypothetical protein